MDIPLSFTHVVIATTAGGAQELVAAVAGKTARIHSLYVGSTAAATLIIESGSTVGSTDLVAVAGPVPFGSGQRSVVPFVKTVEGSIPGTVAHNIQVSSAAGTLAGWATVSISTY